MTSRIPRTAVSAASSLARNRVHEHSRSLPSIASRSFRCSSSRLLPAPDSPSNETAKPSAAALVAQIRKVTQNSVSIARARAALAATGNSLHDALAWLEADEARSGAARAAKLAGRETGQGLICVCVPATGGMGAKQGAAMVEVNCETDFVARNAVFREACARVGATVAVMGAVGGLETDSPTLTTEPSGAVPGVRDSLLPTLPLPFLLSLPTLPLPNFTLSDDPSTLLDVPPPISSHIASAISKLGENVVLRRGAALDTSSSTRSDPSSKYSLEIAGAHAHSDLPVHFSASNNSDSSPGSPTRLLLGRVASLALLRASSPSLPRSLAASSMTGSDPITSLTSLADRVAGHVVATGAEGIAVAPIHVLQQEFLYGGGTVGEVLENAAKEVLGEDYIIKSCDRNLRTDGRTRFDLRPIQIETGFLAQANGSCRVRMDATDVVVGVKAEIGSIVPERFEETGEGGEDDEDDGDGDARGVQVSAGAVAEDVSDGATDRGRVVCAVDCAPSAAPHLTPQALQSLSTELSQSVSRLLNGPGGGLDLKSLCIIPRRTCWILYVDAMILDSSGPLLDPLHLGVRAALLTTQIPHVTVERVGAGPLDFDYDVTPDRTVPISGAASVPVSVTLHKIGGRLVADPSAVEEPCASASVTVHVDAAGKVCGVRKGGKGGLEAGIVKEAVREARKVGVGVLKGLDRILEEEGKRSKLGFFAA
ncbi:Exosome complex component RRP42 [Gonapodya sp. JEL0774]|nr:Exosome complex component RRP42 [Gonapodya sp. JEL0774]